MGKAFQYIRIIFPVFFLLNGSVAFAQASFEGLGDLASGLFSNSAWGVSGDSSVVVGDAISDSGTQAFRWQNDVMPPLGHLPGGNFFSFGQRVSGTAPWSLRVLLVKFSAKRLRFSEVLCSNASGRVMGALLQHPS